MTTISLSGAAARVPPVARPFPTARAALLVCVAYYLGAKVGLALTLQPYAVSTLWPPNALLLGALLLTPVGTWWVLLLAALPAHLAAELHAGIPLPMVLSWFVSNCAEALIGAAAARRLGGRRLRLDGFRSVALFVVVVALLAPFLSSFLDAALVGLNRWGHNGFWPTWRLRFLANVLAMLTVVPAMLAWGQGGLAALRTTSPRRALEAGLLAAGLLAVSVTAFEYQRAGPGTAATLIYAPLPFLLWAAVRFGSGGTSAGILAVALLAIDGASHGHGPFVARSATENALAIQLFLIVIALPLMTLAAVMQERASVQASLRRSEERLTLALSAAQMSVWDWQVPGGAPDATSLGAMADVWGHVHPEDRDAVARATLEALTPGVPFDAEFRVLGPDASVRWVLGKGEALYDQAGKPARLLGVRLDVTARKRAEEALRESERRFGETLTNVEMVAVMLDAQGRLVFANEYVLRLTGWRRDEVIGRSWYDTFVADEDRERVRAMCDAAMAPGPSAVHYESAITTRAGDRRLVRWTTTTLRSPDGRGVGVAALGEDVTERRRLEAEAEEQRRQLAHLGRAALLGELSGALAHELNQPLTAILANAAAARRLLEREPLNVVLLREIVEDVIRDNRRAGEVIRRLRALLERGEMKMRAVNLGEIVGEVLALMDADLLHREIAVELRLSPATPLVLADRVQLQQVVLNLLVNACDAMSGTPAGERRLTIATAAAGDRVQLSIADRGTGIPAEALDRVFEPFFTSKPHGLGLGLAICKSIVTAHRGRLWAVNNPAGGATFHLLLRRYSPAVRRPEREREPGTGSAVG